MYVTCLSIFCTRRPLFGLFPPPFHCLLPLPRVFPLFTDSCVCVYVFREFSASCLFPCICLCSISVAAFLFSSRFLARLSMLQAFPFFPVLASHVLSLIAAGTRELPAKFGPRLQVVSACKAARGCGRRREVRVE